MIYRSEARRGEHPGYVHLFASAALDEGVTDLLPRCSRGVEDLPFQNVREREEMPERPGAGTSTDLDTDQLERQRREEQSKARLDGFAEAQRLGEEELLQRFTEERRRVERLRLEFARDRQRFFAAAESQVVELALAVTRRVLARDAETGGLALRSTVKAALARVQDGSATVLRVAVEEQAAWDEMFQRNPSASDATGSGRSRRGVPGMLEIVSDSTIVAGDCVLETKVGRIELGVDVQMDEVERGFRELMQNQGDE
jgi:flagellar biosynthesis/type III secretory pathway protein FliH